MSERTGFKDATLRAVAIIGLIAILVLGAWGIIQLVIGLPDFFDSFGSSTTSVQEQVVVSNPSSLTSDQAFTLQWSHKNGDGNYGYSVSYACATGLQFAAPVPTGQMQLVPCNTPFNFTNASTSLQLIPVLHTANPVTTSFTVAAHRLSDGSVTASSTTASVTVNPTQAAPATNTTTTKPVATTPVKPVTTKPRASTSQYTASGHTTNLYGSADLRVRILSLTPAANGRYVAQFVIENIGTNVARASWHFEAALPTEPVYVFQSQPQQQMYPGDKIVYTLGFDIPASTQYTCSDMYYCNTQNYYNQEPYFSVTADPAHMVSDSNRQNNTSGATLHY